jgi:hypothetical protein
MGNRRVSAWQNSRVYILAFTAYWYELNLFISLLEFPI